MKTSLSSFVYYNYSLEEAIQHIAVAGFDGVDIWGGRPHAYRNDLHEHEFRHLKGLLDDLGLEIASFTPAQFRYPTNLCSPSHKIHQESIQYIKDSIDTAVRLGASIICAEPGHKLNNQDLDHGWNRLAESLFSICEFAAHYDVLIAIKPGNEYKTDLINTTIQAMDLIDELDCDNLGVLLDIRHALTLGEEISTGLHSLGDRLFHIVITDHDNPPGHHLIPKHGKFDFQSLINTLQKNFYDGFISAELGWDSTIDPDPPAIEAQEFLAKLIEQETAY